MIRQIFKIENKTCVLPSETDIIKGLMKVTNKNEKQQKIRSLKQLIKAVILK